MSSENNGNRMNGKNKTDDNNINKLRAIIGHGRILSLFTRKMR